MNKNSDQPIWKLRCNSIAEKALEIMLNIEESIKILWELNDLSYKKYMRGRWS